MDTETAVSYQAAVPGSPVLARSGREIGTLLRNPDWVQLAEAFGAVGIATKGADDLVPALRDAFTADAPVVVSCPIPRLPNPF